MQKIVFFGDSVTEAHRNLKDEKDLGQGYISMLQEIYGDIKFYNKGIGGQKVNDLLKRFHRDVVDLKPDVCFIWIGVNDAWLPYLLHQSFTKASFVHDYQKLIDGIKKELDKIKLVLIKPYALPFGHVSLNVYEDLEIFRNHVSEIGKKNQVEVLDIKRDMENHLVVMPGDVLFYDGIHPTPEGYRVIANVLERYIKGNS